MQKVRENRLVVNGRLVWYRQDAGGQFWENQWRAIFSQEFYEPYKKGQLGLYGKCFSRFLPKSGRILEAGCGLGSYVLALEKHGYEVDGIDLASETLIRVRSINPRLRLAVATVESLPVPDGCYSGYISLGVVEHREAGPEPYLREAARVLGDDGIAIITVPYFNNLRKWRSEHNAYSEVERDVKFYQFGFTKEEFSRLLGDAGFQIIYRGGLDAAKGLRDECPRLKQWCDSRLSVRLRSVLASTLERVPGLRSCVGHLLVVVAKKKSIVSP